jgi:hypothetical protein
MKRKDYLLQQIQNLESQIESLRKEYNEIVKSESVDINDKIHECHMLQFKFEKDDLVFAATDRCECGHGYAYPKNIGIHGHWYCSGILLGLVEKGSTHSGEKSFMIYEIKSEDQPSANGKTTRP